MVSLDQEAGIDVGPVTDGLTNENELDRGTDRRIRSKGTVVAASSLGELAINQSAP
jgi:hypothetical protein